MDVERSDILRISHSIASLTNRLSPVTRHVLSSKRVEEVSHRRIAVRATYVFTFTCKPSETIRKKQYCPSSNLAPQPSLMMQRHINIICVESWALRYPNYKAFHWRGICDCAIYYLGEFSNLLVLWIRTLQNLGLTITASKSIPKSGLILSCSSNVTPSPMTAFLLALRSPTA